jgi:DNA-binding IclR family transcriptional regulator
LEGVASVAVAVRGSRRAPSAAPAAALTVSGPVSRMTGRAVETIESELRDRAAALESLT